MIEQARDLKNSHEELQRQAKRLRERVIETNNLGYVLQVMEQIEDLLPTLRWIPSREEFPLFREHIDGYDHYRREGTYSFLDMFEEDIWFFVDATEEEQKKALQNEYGWDPYKSVPILWEVVKGGYGKFRFDW